MDIKHVLKDHAYQNRPLSFDEAYQLMNYALAGCKGDARAQIQSIVALSALHTLATYNWRWSEQAQASHNHALPKNASEQIAGVCAAIFEQDIGASEFGYLKPCITVGMDNCGMGGDLIRTANVSTIAALIAATANITMVKHGSPANADSGQHGSSDFVNLLGIDTYADRSKVEGCIETEYFGYTEALDVRYKRIHLQTHTYAMLPHMNDIIGPITNPLLPALHTKRVLGVNHLVSPKLVAEAYQILNQRGITHLKHGLFVRGFTDKKRYEGMDEVSICEGGTQVAELKDDVITEYDVFAKNFGITPVAVTDISPPPGMSKGDFSLALIKGKKRGGALHMIYANAALLFYLDGYADDLKTCYERAKEVFEQGNVYKKAQQIANRLPKHQR